MTRASEILATLAIAALLWVAVVVPYAYGSRFCSRPTPTCVPLQLDYDPLYALPPRRVRIVKPPGLDDDDETPGGNP